MANKTGQDEFRDNTQVLPRKIWYHDPITEETTLFIPGSQPKGWYEGRAPSRHTRSEPSRG